MAHAQTQWLPFSGGAYSWGDESNWSTGVVPTFSTQSVLFGFAPYQPQFIELSVERTLGTLTFSNNRSSFTLTGGKLALDNNDEGAKIRNLGTATNVIASEIGLGDAENVFDVVDGNLILRGLLSGTNGLIKTGEGTLWLRNGVSNTYSGTTFINEGMVISAPYGNTGQALGTPTGVNNHTVIANGATLAIGQANLGQTGITTAEPITVEGRGFRNLGAIRAFNNGAQTATISGAITMTDLTRFHASAGGELTISSAFDVNHTVEITGQRLVNFSGAVSGAGTINNYGMGGLRMLNTTADQTFSGTINSYNGEVRSDPDTAAPVNAAYGNIAALNLRNSWLRLAVRTGAGPTANNALFSTTAPISMAASRIYIDNRAYNANSGSQITYNFSQDFGTTTLDGGHNQIGFRAALTTGSMTMNFADIVLPSASTALQLFVDNAEAGQFLGVTAKNRILNQTLETAGVDVPFLGGNVYSNAEWAKYITVGNGGHGYTPFVAGDYKVNQAVGSWAASDHIKFDNGNFTITADTEIRSLNIQGATARTLGGNAGTTLTIGSGGILTSGGGHVISVPFLTAGAESDYHLYDIAWAGNVINSVITDNGANSVSLVKMGGGTTSLFAANTYTGTTFMMEGQLRDVIGSTRIALGGGNLHFVGSSTQQTTYETDRHFVRSLGSGPGEVQLTGGGSVGGGSSGFSGYGRHIQLNFGGNADPVVWGSTFFNPGVFTLNGGNSTHPVTLVNPLDLGGEQRYIRLDGNSAGGGRGAIGRISADISNGGIVKRGGGTLLIDTPNTYQSGTVVEQGLVWLRAGGSLGANVSGNDIDVRSDGVLHIDSPELVGSRQMIYLQNRDETTPVAIGFGPGYGDGSGIVFNSFNANGGIPEGGGNNIFITDSANGTRRVAIQMNGMEPTSVDFPGLVKAVTAANTQVWFGASTANGVFTGDTLTPTGSGANLAWRLGSGFGTLTVEKANVLDGAATLIVGSNDNNFRTNMGGVAYLPQPQNFTGLLTLNGITGGVTIGNSGNLIVGSDASLNSAGTVAGNTVLLRGGELRLSLAPGAYGVVDSQYAARNIDISQANGILRVESLGGSGASLVELNNLRLDGADRVLTTSSSTTRQNGILFLGTTTLNHTAAANQFLDVGFDNQGFNSGFAFFQGQIVQTGTGGKTLIKRQGGTLVLMADNTHAATQVQQGNLVLTHTGAAGAAGSTITMATNNDRNSRLYFMMDGAGPHTFNNTLTFNGGNNGSVRWVGVGPRTADIANLDTEIRINAMNMNVATSVNNGNIIFDGAHGHRLTVTGNTVMARDTRYRVRGTTLTLDGTVSGAFALNKAEFGTLVLNGSNTYTGVTTVEQGTIVAGHANAFGAATSNVVFSTGSSSQILVSGTTTITRNFINDASGNAQVLGGLDAGAKTLSGNVQLNGRGLNLAAQSGGDVTFSGTISGAGATGITKIGPGSVILNPATTEGNTYSAGTLVASGILAGAAQATSGSPFGTGAMDIRNGALALQGLPGLTTNTATSGALTISGGASLAIWDPAADSNTTTLTFGSLARATNGTLTIVPYTGSLANEERLVFTSAPTLTNGIIAPWVVAAESFTNNAGNFVTYAGGQITSAGAYSGSGDIDGISAGGVWNAAATGGTLTGDRAGYAFRTNANVNLGGHTLSLGDSGQAGIILNDGASITGTSSSRLNLGVNQLALYVDDAADSEVSVPVTSFRSNANNTFTGIGLIKFGQGNLIANAGSFNGLQNSILVSEGTLTAGAANIFPMFENLNALTGGVLTIQPRGTVNLNGYDQEIGNLAGVAPSNNINTRFFDTGGTLNLGAATLTVGREGTTQVFGGQLIGTAGSRLVKVGGGDLSFTNINPDRINSLGTLQIDTGSVTTRADDNSMGQAGNVAFSLPSTTEVILRGGRWNLRSFGDGTGNQQSILVGNNVTAYGGNTILSVDRPEHGGVNKHLLLGDLSIGLNNFLITAGNSYTIGFTGTTTLTNHARIQTDTQLVLRGAIVDGGMGYTLNKIGGSDLGIGADNSTTWSGGYVARQGFTFLGIRAQDEIIAPGNTITGNANANLGTGSIVLSQGFTSTTALRIYALSNILTAQGQTVNIFGSDLAGRVRLDIGTDAPLTDYGLRSTTNGSLSLGIGDGGFYTTPLDLSMMGNGRWGVSAFQTTYYLPQTLGTGVDNVYRMSGTTGTLGLITPGILNGNASLEIGRSPLHVGNVPTSAVAFLRTYGDQSFTGLTTIHRGADTGSIGGIWEFHGDLKTPVIENYGRIEARGDGRFVDNAGNMVNQVILRPGSTLRFNYSMDVNDQFIISRQDNSNLGLNERKWADDEPIFLDGAQLHITSANGRMSEETVGQITVAGGAGLFLERVGGNGQPVLITNEALVRQGQSTLTIRHTTASELGSFALQSQKFFINDAAWVTANRNNGMLDPWIFNLTNLSFLDYVPGSETGMTNATWTQTGTGAAFVAGLTATDRAHYTTGNATLTGQANVYALRIAGASTLTGQQINVHSGGLITNEAVTVNSNLYFGDGSTPKEGILATANNTLTLGGVVTAANLTKAGPGSLVLNSTANQITGNFQMNGGTVTANGPGSLGTATITLHADHLNNNNGNQMPIISFRTASAAGTFNNPIIVAQNVPLARLDFNRFSGNSNGTITLPSLTVQGTDGAGGTLLQFEHQNSYNSAISGEVTLGGTSDVGIRVNAGTTTWNGAVTATMGKLIKSGDGALTMTNLLNDLSTGLILNRGTLVTYANTSAQSFKGNLELNFGQLIFGNTTGTAGIIFAESDQTIAINGQMTLRSQRFGSTNAHMQIGADNNGNVITTSNSPWIIFQANSFGDQMNIRSNIIMNDAPWFRSDSVFARTIGSSVISGEGKFNKAGIWYFALENTGANTYTGGTDIWAGEFNVRSTGSTMGTGAVRLYPGAALAVRNVANLGTTGLTQVVTSASAFPILAVRNGDGGNAQFDAVLAAYAGANFLGNGNGIIGLGGGRNYSADLDMANRNGGIFANWWLGGTEGSGTISANSLSPWGPAGDEFRLGGAHTGTLTMNPATAGSAQLAGAGNRLIIGGGLNHMGYGTVVIGANSDNTFDGGTLVQLTREVGGTSIRGAVLSVQGGANGAAWRSPLGSGQVDVFGEIRIEQAAGTAANSATTNANTWVFHPGSRIRFDNDIPFTGTGGGGRWGDEVGITLNTAVLEMYGDATTVATNTETIGDLTIQGGSEVVVRRRGAFLAEIIAGDLTRVGSATLTVTGMDTNTSTVTGLGSGAATTAMRFKVTNGASFMDNGMVAPWIMDRIGGQFMKYTADGFAPITLGGAPANYISSAGGTLTMAANDGTEILSLGTATATLGANLDLYALRTDRDINVSADGQFQNIILRSGGLTQFANTPTINANLFFGAAGDGTGEALIHASNNTLQINGKIHASQVTKFGSAFLSVRSDQPQFTGDWVINGGGIQFLTPGAPSSGTIYLNGSRMNDRDNTHNLTEVRFNFNSQSPDLFTWSHGKIISTGHNRIYGIATNDRQIAIGDIDLMGTGAAQEGLVTLRMDGSRSVMHTGTVKLFGHYQLNIENNLNSGGTTTGVQIGVLDNQGLYNVRKSGWGLLYLGDQSASFTNASFSVAHGGVRALHNGSFGDATASVIIDPTGALEIAVANWVPLASLTQAWGSSERWSVDFARGAGNWTMAPGVNLQIMASQTGTRTITLDGGALAGYVPIDWDQDAIIHTLAAGITVNLASDSLLGQLQPAGNSNGSNHAYYDNGKLNTTTNLNPIDPGLRGSYLQILGEITGAGGITKVGQDLILLAGANTYSGATQIDNGILQIGQANSLPTGTDLTTRFTGMLDLNGHNQEVASLQGTGGSINNGAFALNTLALNQTTTTTYGGQINGNVSVVMNNTGSLTLTGVNGMRGDLIINDGSVILSGAGSVNEARSIQIGAGKVFNVDAVSGGVYTYDGKVSGGGVGALRADNASRAQIIGSLSIQDGVGSIARQGSMSPGANGIGHIQVTGDLTLAGGLWGTTTKVERLTLELAAPTSTLAALGWDGSNVADWLVNTSPDVLNGLAGDVSGHDYVNVGGDLTLSANGGVGVVLVDGYQPQYGDVFNLLDWTTVSAGAFNAGPSVRSGGEVGYDLNLPDLTAFQLTWHTDLFASHGVIFVVPEPSRAVLLFLGLAGLLMRRRRA